MVANIERASSVVVSLMIFGAVRSNAAYLRVSARPHHLVRRQTRAFWAIVEVVMMMVMVRDDVRMAVLVIAVVAVRMAVITVVMVMLIIMDGFSTVKNGHGYMMISYAVHNAVKRHVSLGTSSVGSTFRMGVRVFVPNMKLAINIDMRLFMNFRMIMCMYMLMSHCLALAFGVCLSLSLGSCMCL